MPRFLAGVVVAALSVVAAPATADDTFPTKSIKIVMPIPVGTALDVVTRLVGEQLAGRLGQQVVVENRPGAGGLIAAQAVATAPPDGYTLLGGGGAIFTILPAQKAKLPIDVNRDLVQVGMVVSSTPMYLAVSPRLGVGSFPEFVAMARSKPGEIIVGTNGAGTLPHFAAVALATMGNIPITVVPYNQGGSVAAITDIIGGRVHATVEAVFGLRGALQAGDLKLIAAMSLERDSFFPDIPTVAATVPVFSAVGFMTLAAPAGTSELIVRRLNRSLAVALEAPSVKHRFEELGVPAKVMTPEETKAFVEREQRFWWPLVRKLESM